MGLRRGCEFRLANPTLPVTLIGSARRPHCVSRPGERAVATPAGANRLSFGVAASYLERNSTCTPQPELHVSQPLWASQKASKPFTLK